MNERYPYTRFVSGAGELLSGAVALVLFLGGTTASCEQGGFGGFVSFVVTLLLAVLGYVAAMVWVETKRVALDIEESLRQIALRPDATPSEGPAA